MKVPPKIALIAVSLASVAVAACGGETDPLGSAGDQAAGAPIVVGSANFTESQILAEAYSQALRAKGVESSTKLNIGSREVYIKALQDESIAVVPEYTGNLLLHFDKNASATTAEEIEAALPAAVGEDLKVLKPSPAADQDVYVVTQDYSEKNGVTSLEDLSKVASNAILGGPSELATRAYGVPGLEKIYGAKFKQFKPYDAPAVKVRDLNDNKIQVATFFTTEAAIVDNRYVMLADPQSMILPQNVIPLVRAEVAGNAAAVAAIEAVQAALTTQELTLLNKKVDSERQDPGAVAAEWLKDKGLA